MFSSLDTHFAEFIQRLDGRNIPDIFLAAALVSSSNRQGHICLDLKKVEGKILVTEENSDSLVCPPLEIWLEKLRDSPVVGKPGEFKPLILDAHSRLYLYRYWEYQEKLADLINNRIRSDEKKINFQSIRASLNQYFRETTDPETDWQKVAAFTSLTKNFCVISGGPGTGKTTTLAKIMAFLQEQNQSKPLRIALAAPTGKAAARLQEAIQNMKSKLTCPERIKKIIPEETSTIHRLVGAIPGSPYFRYHAQNPLPVDTTIIDEASMVDLALMSKLIQALPPQSKLILVGDKDQLASVEAGAVLGDICDTGNNHGYSKDFYDQIRAAAGIDLSNPPDENSESGIQDCIIQLRKSYRFGDQSGIGAVSRAVNQGDGALAIEMLQSPHLQDADWGILPQPKALSRSLREKILIGYCDYLKAEQPDQIFQLFERFRILCAFREGPYGVAAINALVEEILQSEKLIQSEKNWYHGRPIMITTNDYHLNLFNGDVGIALIDPETNHELRVFFIGPDRAIRKFHPLRLPPHETVYAMTVHKSQGSEFDEVLLLLPDTDAPVLTRELIYTGMTRAKKSVAVWGVESLFKNAN